MEVLGVVMNDLGDVTPRVSVLRSRLATAAEAERSARAYCVKGDRRHAKKLLVSAVRRLSRLRAVLGWKATKSLPGRNELLAAVDAVRADVRVLGATLVCPAAALDGVAL